MINRLGSCRCGQVKYEVRGPPLRVGICHCTDCRQESGSAFTFFGVWPQSEFDAAGNTVLYEGRRFCPRCGSRMFSCEGNEVEIKLGTLADAPTSYLPTYELWVKRREPWLLPIDGAEQHWEDRRPPSGD
ncbi:MULTISPECIES: GFA family protein [Ensifer]|uniref:GFA family protein n=1 Tax=Ensifer TaxID=106591 RepID=UPI0009E7B913|nr:MULTISPECIES: GFA family protein [Ensifer]NOV21821.1 GFA family protein [Ensifer canadensis]